MTCVPVPVITMTVTHFDLFITRWKHGQHIQYICTYILIAIVSVLPECSQRNRCSQQISKNKWLKLQQLPISFKLLKSPTSTFHHRSAYEKEIWEMTAFPSGEPGDGCFAILGSYLDCGSRVRCHYSPLLVACIEAVGGAASDRLWRVIFKPVVRRTKRVFYQF